MPKTLDSKMMKSIPAGLVLIGTLSGRRRRKVEMKDKTSRFVHQLTVRGEDRVELVERWSDESLPPDMPSIGDSVAIPVRVRVFNSAMGPQFRLVFGDAPQGEAY